MVMLVPRGDRTFLLMLVLPLVALRYLRRGVRPRLAAVVATLLVGILVLGALVQHRDVSSNRQPLDRALANAVSGPDTALKNFILSADLGMLSVLSSGYETVPDKVPFNPGVQLTSLAAVPVPGGLWPDKPKESADTVFQLLFPSLAKVTRSGQASSLFGGFYYDSGFIGVFAYSAIIGLLLRVLFEYYRRGGANRNVVLVYAALLPVIVATTRTSMTLAAGFVPFNIAPYFIAIWYSGRVIRRRRHA
jgi:hypothetical protein